MSSSLFTTMRATAAAVTTALLAAAAAPAFALPGPGDHATPLEISLLPRYCKGTFQPALAKAPADNIVDCGGYMNHFCPALVLISRVSEPGRSKFDRQVLVSRARNEMDYTLQHMTPTCSIANDVRGADSRLRIYERLYK